MTRQVRSPRRGSGVCLGLAWIVALVATLFALHALGRGELATPPLASLDRLRAWLDDRGTVTGAFALVRLVALVLAWYLLAVTLLGLLARLVDSPSLVRVADLTTIPLVRRLLGTIVGVGLSASTAALAAAPLLSQAHHGPVVASPGRANAEAPGAELAGGEIVLRRLPTDSTVVMKRVIQPDDDDDDDTATMQVTDDTATMRVIEGTATMSVVGPDRPAPPPPPALATWSVRAGDHFWGVANSVLSQSWARQPSEAEVTPYWHLLVEYNRGRLVDPSNPDLIYPGQVFELPPPPAAP